MILRCPTHEFYSADLQLLDDTRRSLCLGPSLTSDQADLDNAVENAQHVVDLTPQDHSDRPTSLNMLGVRLSVRYSLTSEKADLDRAIEATQQAVNLTPEGHSDLPMFLNNLGLSLSDRYALMSERADLDKAIEITKRAINLTSEGHSDLPTFLNSLGSHLSDRHAVTSEKVDLDMAVEATQQALDLTPESHSDRSRWLNNLGIRLSDRYAMTSEKTDLDMAIEITQRAINLTSGNHSDQPKFLNNLGISLSHRFSLTSERADLDRAIEIIQQAIDLTPEDHIDRPTFLNSLGLSLSDRHAMTSEKADLDKAIELTQQAIDLTPRGHNDESKFLNNLGVRLSDRYSLTSDRTDLDRAVEVTQQAISLTPEGHSHRPRHLNNLGSHLSARYSLTSEKADLDRAIEITQQVASLTPESHSDLPMFLNNLGSQLSDRYSLMREENDFALAVSAHRRSSSSLIAAVTERLRGYKCLLRLFGDRQEWTEGLQAGSDAIKILPNLAPRSLAPSDKQRVLSLVAGLASDVAVMALHLCRPLKAIELLEQGRGVLLADLMDLRAVPPELERQYPELAKRFIHVRERLNAPAAPDHSRVSSLRISSIGLGDARRHANAEFTDLLHEIRQQTGFEDFMQPLGQKEIQCAASEGPVVYINVSDYRCDALIVEKDSVRSVPLGTLTVKRITSRKTELSMSGLQSTDLLQWLWDSVASPILEDLRVHGSLATDSLPRLWWIPTGLLSRFPIHAAGYHLEQPPKSVLDVSVSSFASSLKSILRSRSKPAKRFIEGDQLILIAMENTPACRTLPFASIESEEVKKLCQGAELEIIEPLHRKKLVLDSLASCKIFHFAGHGQSHPVDPLQSQLLLEDWQQDQLTLADFLKTRASNHTPFLAYLSACSTGQIQNESMLDEGLHLVNAFQLAGFQHVIGTMWEVDDQICAEVARIVYGEILQHLTHKSVSLGLHMAMKQCRNQWRKYVLGDIEELADLVLPRNDRVRDYGPQCAGLTKGLEWVPYAHFGG